MQPKPTSPLRNPAFIQRVLFFVKISNLKRIVEFAGVSSSWDDTVFEQGHISVLWGSSDFQKKYFFAEPPNLATKSQDSTATARRKQEKCHDTPGAKKILQLLQQCCKTKESVENTTRIRHAMFHNFIENAVVPSSSSSLFDKFRERGEFFRENDFDNTSDHLQTQHEVTIQMFYCSLTSKHRVCGGFPLRFELPSLKSNNNNKNFAVIITGQKGNNLLHFDYLDNKEEPYTWEIDMMPPAAYHHLANYPTASDAAPSSIVSATIASPKICAMSQSGKFYATIHLEDSDVYCDDPWSRDYGRNYSDKHPCVTIYDVKTGTILEQAENDAGNVWPPPDSTTTRGNSRFCSLRIRHSEIVKKSLLLSQICFSADDRFLYFGVGSFLCVAEIIDSTFVRLVSTIADFTPISTSYSVPSMVFTCIKTSSCGKYLAAQCSEQLYFFNLNIVDDKMRKHEKEGEENNFHLFARNATYSFRPDELLRNVICGKQQQETDENDSTSSFSSVVIRAIEFHPIHTNLLSIAITMQKSEKDVNEQYVAMFDLVHQQQQEEEEKKFVPKLVSYVETKHYSNIFSIAVSPDGKTLATGSRDQRIHLFDFVENEKCNSSSSVFCGWEKRKTSEKRVSELEGHLAPIWGLSFCHFSSKILLSSSLDGTVRFWNIEAEDLDNAFQKEISLKSGVLGAHMSNDGEILVICAREQKQQQQSSSDGVVAREHCRFYSVTRNGKRNREKLPTVSFRYPVVKVDVNIEEGVYEIEDVSGEVQKVEV